MRIVLLVVLVLDRRLSEYEDGNEGE